MNICNLIIVITIAFMIRYLYSYFIGNNINKQIEEWEQFMKSRKYDYKVNEDYIDNFIPDKVEIDTEEEYALKSNNYETNTKITKRKEFFQ